MLKYLYFNIVSRIYLGVKYKYFYAGLLTYVDRITILNCCVRFYGRCVITKSEFGSYTYATNARITNSVIGSFCSIGPDTMIGGLGKHPTKYISTSPTFYSDKKQTKIILGRKTNYEELPRVRVGNDVWIGARVLVLDGVNIGDGAVIAAGSVVDKNVQPYTIVGGVPARPIKVRFDDERKTIIEKSQWWDWDDKKLKELGELFSLPVSEMPIKELTEILTRNHKKENKF